jgi:hypothetical protein
MMFQPVSHDQFEIKEYELVHLPTGARFTRYPGQHVLRHVFWNDAGERTEFRKLDIFNAATALIGGDAMDRAGAKILRPVPANPESVAPTASESPRREEPLGVPAPSPELVPADEPLDVPPTAPSEIPSGPIFS